MTADRKIPVLCAGKNDHANILFNLLWWDVAGARILLWCLRCGCGDPLGGKNSFNLLQGI